MDDKTVTALGTYGYDELLLSRVSAAGIDGRKLLDILDRHGAGMAALGRRVLEDWLAGRLSTVPGATLALLGYVREYGSTVQGFLSDLFGLLFGSQPAVPTPDEGGISG